MEREQIKKHRHKKPEQEAPQPLPRNPDTEDHTEEVLGHIAIVLENDCYTKSIKDKE